MPNSTLVNLVRTLILNTGTDTLQLGQAVPAFRGVEALTDAATYSYSIQQGSNYETGQGVFNAQDNTLTRGVIESSAGNGPIILGPNGVCAFTALDIDFQLPGRPGVPGDPGLPGEPGQPGQNGAGINMPVKRITADYTLTLDDANTYLQIDSPTAVVITAPPVSVVNYPVDIVVAIEQTGEGNVSVQPGAGVTVTSRNNAMQTAGQGAVIQLKNTAQNAFTLLGDAGPNPGGIPDAPSDGTEYARQNGAWVPAGAGLPDLAGNAGKVLTVNTAEDGVEWGAGGGGGGGGSGLKGLSRFVIGDDFAVPAGTWTAIPFVATDDALGVQTAPSLFTVPAGVHVMRVSFRTAWYSGVSAPLISFKNTTTGTDTTLDLRNAQFESSASVVTVWLDVVPGHVYSMIVNTGNNSHLSGVNGTGFGRPTQFQLEMAASIADLVSGGGGGASAPVSLAYGHAAVNGSGAITIDKSGNVAAITRNAVGRYHVTFTAPVPFPYLINFGAKFAATPDNNDTPQIGLNRKSDATEYDANGFDFIVQASDGQTLIDPAFLWFDVPNVGAAAGGGGGGTVAAPTIAQQVFAHIQGSAQAVTLPAAPTPGNTLVAIIVGAGDSDRTQVPQAPAGWSIHAYASNGGTAGIPGQGPAFQSAMVYSRAVDTGDGAAVAFTSSNGANVMLLELAGEIAVDVSGIVALAANAGAVSVSPSGVRGAMKIAAVECDGQTAFSFADGAISTLGQANPAGGHAGIFGQLPTGYNKPVSVAYTSAPSYPLGFVVGLSVN